MHLKLGSQESGWMLLHHCYEDREFARNYITKWRIRNQKSRTGFGPSFAKQVSAFNKKLKIHKPVHDTDTACINEHFSPHAKYNYPLYNHNLRTEALVQRQSISHAFWMNYGHLDMPGEELSELNRVILCPD